MASESQSQDNAEKFENERLREVIRALHDKNPDLFEAGLKDIHADTRGLVEGVLQKSQAVNASAAPDPFEFDTPKPCEGMLRRSELTKLEEVIGSENADMEFDPSPAVKEALLEGALEFRYREVPAELDNAIIRWLKKVHNWEIKEEQKEQIVKLVDANSAIAAACSTYAKKRGRIVTCLPAYYAARIASERTQIPLKTFPLTEGTNEIDTVALDKVLKKGDVFVLTNPHNPTGHVYTEEELRACKKVCDQKGVTIIMDEVHDGLVLDEQKKMVSMGSLYEEGETNNTITLLSTGKNFNLSHAPCPVMIIPDEQKRKQFEANCPMRANHISNPVANRAAIAAYEQSDEWMEKLIEYLRVNRKIVFDRINAIDGLSMQMPESTYLAWVDARGAGLDQEPADFLAQKANVAVYSGRNFDVKGGTDYSHFFRLNFALPRKELEKMLDGIEEALLIERAKKELMERFPDLEITDISLLDEQGLDNRVFRVNDDLIFRFPKTAKTSKFLEREVALMPILSQHVTTRIPNYEFVSMPSEKHETCLAGCTAFSGETLNPERYQSLDSVEREQFLGAIAQFMREMHSVPVEDARKCEGVSEWDDEGTYKWYGNKFFPTNIYPFLDDQEQKKVNGLFAEYMNDPQNKSYQPVLLHGDMKLDHIFIDDKRSVEGIIDFNPMIGNRDYDFMRLYAELPRKDFRRLLELYGHPDPEKCERDSQLCSLCYWAQKAHNFPEKGNPDQNEEAWAKVKQLIAIQPQDTTS